MKATAGPGVLINCKLALLQVVQEAAGAAVGGMNLTLESATILINKNGELANRIKGATQHVMREFLVSNEFANEQVLSTHGYGTGYNRSRSPERQLELLKEYFPTITFEPLPKNEVHKLPGTEGLFLIPRWRLFGKTYGEAVERVFQKLKRERNGFFKNLCPRELDASHLRQSKRTRECQRLLSLQQGKPNTLVIPAQFGVHHAGSSAQRARMRFAENEFGLGVFATAIMLLLHSDRLGGQHDLNIMCVGDQYNRGKGRRFDSIPMFRFDQETGYLEFTDGSPSLALSESSSVTGFLPNG